MLHFCCLQHAWTCYCIGWMYKRKQLSVIFAFWSYMCFLLSGCSAKANLAVLLFVELYEHSPHSVHILKAIDQKSSAELVLLKDFDTAYLSLFHVLHELQCVHCTVYSLTISCWAKWFWAEEWSHKACELRQQGKYVYRRLCCIPFFHSQFVEGTLRTHYTRLVLSDKTVGTLD